VTHRSVEQHALALNQRDLQNDGTYPEYEWTTCDAGGSAAMATLREHYIPVIGIRSPVLPGLELVRRQLKIRGDQTPGLYVVSNCVNTIKEFNLYSYPEKGGENPVTQWDHSLDCLRYYLTHWKRGYVRQYTGTYN